MTEQNSYTNQPEAASQSASLPEDARRSMTLVGIEFLTRIVGHKWLIMGVTALAMLIGVLYSLSLPNQYSADVKIMPPREAQSTTSLMNSMSGGGSSFGGLATAALSLRDPNIIYMALLKSRPIADAIIDKFDLQKAYRVQDMSAARVELANNTHISSAMGGLISISVTDLDKSRAAAIANAYPEQLRNLTKTLAIAEASQRLLFYEEQLKQAKEALVAAAIALEQVQQQKGLVQLDAQARAMIEGLAGLRAQVSAKQVEVQALRSYSTEQNPDVQLREKELASIQAEEAHLEQRSSSPGIANLGLGNVPSAGLEYIRAEHELQYQQALYDLLMRQYEAAKLDESKGATVIQVVDPAIPPERKSAPHRSTIVLVLMVLGLFGLYLYLHLRNLVRCSPEFSQSLARFRSVLLSR